MKNKSTKKRTILKIVLVPVVITGGVLLFLLPSRCGNENVKTEIPRPDDISFESGSSAWVEPEKTDSRAEKHDEVPSVPAPFTAVVPRDTGSSDPVETKETSAIIENPTPVTEMAEKERTAAIEEIPVAAEAPMIVEAPVKVEVIFPTTAPEEITADKNAASPPPKELVNKSETEPPKETINKDAALVVVKKPENLQATVGISTEKAGLDSKSIQGARTQYLTPFASSKAAIHKSAEL
ncbi:MAG: hypothetical protein LBV68_03415, partial [Spirochaetaceae bacterium]|nr:hypothetical protein [Spirochaetaceae bacterium]